MDAPDPRLAPQAFLTYLYSVAVQRAQPLHCLKPFLPEPPKGRTLVLGAGKASGAMAQAVEALWPANAPLSGLVVTRYDHVPPRAPGLPYRIEVVEASHPVPDAAGLAAAQRILDMAHGLTADDLVLCLISGGGSSLLSLPAPGMALADKQKINQALLASGATIGEMNCVRKHLSAIKGGRLALACAPARVVSLLISDVPGDDPTVIASGPTVADPTSCADALAVLQRYAIDVPPEIRAALAQGILETPKPDHPALTGNQVQIVATPQQSLEAAAQAARDAGIAAYILSDSMEGESREVGQVHAALARAVARQGQPFARPCVILSGGETTVTLRPRAPGAPKGRGGRAGEFCMGLAHGLQGQDGVYALAADTDGIDGVENNAGAHVSPDTLARARARGHKLENYLDRNDAYGYFEALDDLFVTGPTFTNVNDFRAILVL
jgi:hydroxypyruvate reductase